MSARRLRLVPPPPAEAEERGALPSEDEPPFDEAELRAAEALRDALETDADPLALALRCAAAPSPGSLDAVDHESLLARAFGDLEAPPTKAEQVAADRLRDALDGGAAGACSDAHLAHALRVAVRPPALDVTRNVELVERALAMRVAPSTAPAARVDRATGAGGRVLRFPVAALAALTAMAAGFSLFFATRGATLVSPAALETAGAEVFIRARSTEGLFDATEPFPRAGGESARIDRIASARSSDLRANRFAAWGVR